MNTLKPTFIFYRYKDKGRDVKKTIPGLRLSQQKCFEPQQMTDDRCMQIQPLPST